MSLLTLIQDACDLIPLARPSSVIGSTAQEVRELLGVAQEEGLELSRRYDWQKLTKEKTFTSVATETQTSMVASDLDRFVAETFWNRSKRRPFRGPVTAQEWQQVKSWTTSPVPEIFRYRGSDILVQPVPTAGDTFVYEYISTQWCESSGGTDQSAWAADADVGLLPERLMKLGIIWRWKAMKSFPFETDYQLYESQVQQAILRDKPQRTVNMALGERTRRPGIVVPDGDWAV